MNFVSVRVITADVARLVAFYERVTGATAAWSSPDFAQIRTGTATLAIAGTRTVALFAPGPGHPAAVGPADNHSVIIEFLVEDADAVHGKLTALGEEFVSGPATMPWGNRSALLRDPDGNLVNLFTPAAP